MIPAQTPTPTVRMPGFVLIDGGAAILASEWVRPSAECQ
jgi:hypothetical protein